jgi:hypothetical protein
VTSQILPPVFEILWELRHKSGLIAVCYLRRIDGSRVAMNLSVENDETLREHFDVERDALIRAQALRRDFLRKGWTNTHSSDGESA